MNDLKPPLDEETKAPTYEERMARLEAIAQALEQGERPLSEQLALFEEAQGLIQSCQKELDEVEQTLVKITETGAVPLDGR